MVPGMADLPARVRGYKSHVPGVELKEFMLQWGHASEEVGPPEHAHEDSASSPAQEAAPGSWGPGWSLCGLGTGKALTLCNTRTPVGTRCPQRRASCLLHTASSEPCPHCFGSLEGHQHPLEFVFFFIPPKHGRVKQL